MEIEQHGKLQFRKILNTDFDKLVQFCEECKKLNYINNSSLDSIKFAAMNMPYGEFFVGIDEDKNIIFNLAGVHILSDLGINAYRVLFRGAVLPGYSTGKGFLKNSWQFLITLNQQIDFILKINPHAEFYLTSNKKQDHGKSEKIDIYFNPRAERLGLIDLVDSDFFYMNTHQRLWKINVSNYKNWRSI